MIISQINEPVSILFLLSSVWLRDTAVSFHFRSHLWEYRILLHVYLFLCSWVLSWMLGYPVKAGGFPSCVGSFPLWLWNPKQPSRDWQINGLYSSGPSAAQAGCWFFAWNYRCVIQDSSGYLHRVWSFLFPLSLWQLRSTDDDANWWNSSLKLFHGQHSLVAYN